MLFVDMMIIIMVGIIVSWLLLSCNGFTLAIGWMDDALSLVEDYFLLYGGFAWLKRGLSC